MVGALGCKCTGRLLRINTLTVKETLLQNYLLHFRLYCGHTAPLQLKKKHHCGMAPPSD
jgi:hypothetical protein